MTFADELRNEGRVEGRTKGIEKGIEKVTINALKQGLPKRMIAQLTGLSLKRINQIKQQQNP